VNLLKVRALQNSWSSALSDRAWFITFVIEFGRYVQRLANLAFDPHLQSSRRFRIQARLHKAPSTHDPH
jgi:hypothetical protein